MGSSGKANGFDFNSERLIAVITLDAKSDGLTKEEIASRVFQLYDLPDSSVAKVLKEGLKSGILMKKDNKYVVNHNRDIPKNNLCGTCGKKILDNEPKKETRKSERSQKKYGAKKKPSTSIKRKRSKRKLGQKRKKKSSDQAEYTGKNGRKRKSSARSRNTKRMKRCSC